MNDQIICSSLFCKPEHLHLVLLIANIQLNCDICAHLVFTARYWMKLHVKIN